MLFAVLVLFGTAITGELVDTGPWDALVVGTALVLASLLLGWRASRRRDRIRPTDVGHLRLSLVFLAIGGLTTYGVPTVVAGAVLAWTFWRRLGGGTDDLPPRPGGGRSVHVPGGTEPPDLT